MRNDLSESHAEYLSVLQDHIAGAQETALLRVYEVGRRCVDEGFGGLEIAAVHAGAVSDALRDAGKRGEIERTLIEEREAGIAVRIKDDGVGFDPEAGCQPVPGHLGPPAIRERAEMAGGWLRVESAPGDGTAVEFWIP